MAGKPIYAVGLDAGSRMTRMIVCLLESGRLRLLGGAAVESQGWIKGKIADQEALAESITAALREAEADSGTSIGSAVVGVGGPTLRGANGRGVIELGHVREIEQRDINRVVDRAARVQLQEDQMLLQLSAQDFVVDDHPGHRDPRKMLASRLEINVHLVLASIQEHNALLGAVNHAHLLVEETVFEALAGCYASVLPEDRREGIAVVDIGAHSTELAVYAGDSLCLAGTLRICGDHFSRDLAQGLCLSFEDAEIVKMEFGCASAASSVENAFIELPPHQNRSNRDAQRKFVNEILEARAREVFRFVRSEIVRAGMDRALMGGVFLTGGGAKLPDLCDIAESELRCQTRYGLPVGIEEWPETMNDPEWTAAAGLAMYSAKIKQQAESQRAKSGWMGRMWQ